MIQLIAFYLFATVAIAAAAMVIFARNPVHSVMWLILAFFNAAGLMLLTGAESPLVVVVSTLLIAALFGPLRVRVQQTIDRRFYRRRYDAGRTLAAFSQVARTTVDLEPLSEHLLGVVQETMQPAHAGLTWVEPVPHPSEPPRLSTS